MPETCKMFISEKIFFRKRKWNEMKYEYLSVGYLTGSSGFAKKDMRRIVQEPLFLYTLHTTNKKDFFLENL